MNKKFGLKFSLLLTVLLLCNLAIYILVFSKRAKLGVVSLEKELSAPQSDLPIELNSEVYLPFLENRNGVYLSRGSIIRLFPMDLSATTRVVLLSESKSLSEFNQSVLNTISHLNRTYDPIPARRYHFLSYLISHQFLTPNEEAEILATRGAESHRIAQAIDAGSKKLSSETCSPFQKEILRSLRELNQSEEAVQYLYWGSDELWSRLSTYIDQEKVIIADGAIDGDKALKSIAGGLKSLKEFVGILELSDLSFLLENLKSKREYRFVSNIFALPAKPEALVTFSLARSRVIQFLPEAAKTALENSGERVYFAVSYARFYETLNTETTNEKGESSGFDRLVTELVYEHSQSLGKQYFVYTN